MATFTLDSIRDAAEKKYSSTEIQLDDGDVLVLTNPLRLPKDKRKALMSMQDRLEDDEDDVEQEEILADAVRLVANDRALAEKLIEEIGDDIAVLAELFSTYTGAVQLGEASASQS